MAAENKMGVMPVNKLLISMSLPMIISMLVQAMYNIVDSVFVAQVSENALTAVSLAFPFVKPQILYKKNNTKTANKKNKRIKKDAVSNCTASTLICFLFAE